MAIATLLRKHILLGLTVRHVHVKHLHVCWSWEDDRNHCTKNGHSTTVQIGIEFVKEHWRSLASHPGRVGEERLLPRGLGTRLWRSHNIIRKSCPGETGLITRNYGSAQFGTLGNYPVSFCVRLSISSLTSLAILAFTDEGCGTNRLLDERKQLRGRLRDFFALFAAISQVSLDRRLWPCYNLASFPGLPQLHSLIYSSTVSKLNWRLVRPGNKANCYLLV